MLFMIRSRDVLLTPEHERQPIDTFLRHNTPTKILPPPLNSTLPLYHPMF